MTSPRVVHEVKPHYTFAAIRAKVEGVVTLALVVETDGSVGDVRVVRSLDAQTGLDEQSVVAAKQWRFTPGAKDGVAVPTLVTLQLTFLLREQNTGPLGMPEALMPQAGAVSANRSPDESAWTSDVVDDAGLRIGVSHPADWRRRPAAGAAAGTGTGALLLQKATSDSLWIFDVRRPTPTSFRLREPQTDARLRQFAERLARSFDDPSRAELRGVGQVEIGTRPWIWVDSWIGKPELSAAIPPEWLAAVRSVGGFHLWTFTTTEGDRLITVTCSLITARDRPSDETDNEIHSLGAVFAEMLKRLTIEPAR